jgi:hypothetical protein
MHPIRSALESAEPQSTITVGDLVTTPSGLLPIGMSMAALGLVVFYVATSGIAPQADEGTAARLWQFLMAAQLPVSAYFALRWLGRAPRQAAVVLAAQVGAALVAAAPVYLLGF